MKFIMLVGLPGSGKSTLAKKLALKESAEIVSSDAIREELFGSAEVQENNALVFDTMFRRTANLLALNKSVIYDSTNLSSKRRRALLSKLVKINCEKNAYLLATPYETCLCRNVSRERKVPECVMRKMYTSFNVPCTQEGFDGIKIVYPDDIQFKSCYDVITPMLDQPHDNPHHSATIGQHMKNAYDWLCAKYAYVPEVIHDSELIIATFLHDIGKPKTKVFTDHDGNATEIAHYYGHNNVGAYEVLFVNMPENIKINVSLLIQYHMNYYISWKQSYRAECRDRVFLGENLCKKLDILHECDLAAH